MTNNKTREDLAKLQHERWSAWMDHMFSMCDEQPDGSFVIPLASVRRWRRQMATPYSRLSETEKASDQAEADRVIEVLNQEN